MNEKAEKQTQEKLNKWLREMDEWLRKEIEDINKKVEMSDCEDGACDISKGEK